MPQSHLNSAVLAFGDYAIENNAWGYEGASPPQSVQAPPDAPMRWRWDWRSVATSPETVIAYPEIIYGKKPFLERSTCAALPARLDSLSRLEVAYVAQTRARGVYNTAIEAWITRRAQGRVEDISHEVMVWVDRRGLQPAGDWVESLDAPCGRVERHVGAMRHWRYHAFVLRKPRAADRLDLGFFLRRLIEAGEIDAGDYLASVEFGNEIAQGHGHTELEHFAVHLG